MTEFLIIVAVILLIILLISISTQKTDFSNKLDRIDKKVNIVYKELVQLKKNGVNISDNTNNTNKEQESLKEQPVFHVKETPPIDKQELDTSVTSKEETKEKEEITIPHLTQKETEEKKIEEQPVLNTSEDKLAEEINKLEDKTVEKKVEDKVELVVKTNNPQSTSSTNKKPQLEQEPREKRSVEQAIGENWLNKIGIAILILGIGYSVKYAIDKNWINETGRLLIGLLSGGILLSFAYFLKKNYRAFSSVLAGGAIATFYYTITIGYQYYGMFNQPTAFAIMIGITLFSTFLAVKYDRLELAAIALIGGFTSPFMVSGESNNYIAFFSYLSILNVGMLILAYFKKWNLIKYLAFGFTTLLFGGWTLQILSYSWVDLNGKGVLLSTKAIHGLLFSSLFYVIFYCAHLIYNLTRKQKFDGGQFAALLCLSVFYWAGGMTFLNYIDGGVKFQGLFTAGIAVINLLVAVGVRTNKTVDQNLFFLLVGKSTVLLSLFPLIQFEGYYISAFWLLEATALIWIGQKTKINLFKHLSVIVFFISCFSLAVNWIDYYGLNNYSTLFANKAFAITTLGILSYITSILLLTKDDKKSIYLFFNPKSYIITLKIWIGIVAYLTLLFEINQATHGQDFGNADKWVTSLINFGYHFGILISLVFMFRKSKNELVLTLSFLAILFMSIIYISLGNMGVIKLRNISLIGDLSSIWFMLHYLVVGAIVVSYYLYYRFFIKGTNKTHYLSTFFYISVCFITVYLCSTELDHTAVYLFSDDTTSYPALNMMITKITGYTQKAGYTVLWAICSFVMMFIGMKYKVQVLRIISLCLLLVVLIKLLLFDIYNLTEGAKIIAFIGLGVILLVVSFMYQRLKKLIVEGE